MHVSLIRATIALTAALLGSSASFAGPVIDGYTALTFGSFSSSYSDSEGTVLVGGNAYLQGYAVNTRGTANHDVGLVVGGSVSLTNGQVWGDLVAGGAMDLQNAGILGSRLQQDSSALFQGWEYHFLQLSSTYASLADSGKVTRTPWGGLDFNAQGPSDVEVFSVTAQEVMGTNSWSFQGLPAGQRVILNVSGSEVKLSNLDLSRALGAYDFVFNFEDALTVTFENTSPWASVLAPKATILGRNGHIQGNVVANAWDATLELHNGRSEGLPLPTLAPSEPGNTAPEPDSLLLVACALGAFTWATRRAGRAAPAQ